MNTLTIAKSYLNEFTKSDDPIIAASFEAGECCALESKIESGISAAKWIFLTSEAIREIFANEIKIELPDGKEFDFEYLSREIEELYKWWRLPCEDVEKSITEFQNIGYSISNKDEYFAVKEKVEQKIRVYKMREESLVAHEEGYFDGDLVD